MHSPSSPPSFSSLSSGPGESYSSSADSGNAVITATAASTSKGTISSPSLPISALSQDILVCVLGATVRIPEDFATLKQALARAPLRARQALTIRMQEGTFDAAVVHVPNVRIVGAGPGKTKLVGSLVVVGGVKGCFVSNLSIMCSRGAGVDVSGLGSQLELSHCRVADCDGSGVVAGEGSECIITGCVVEKNQAHGVAGHGALTNIVITNTKVRYNRAHGVCAEHGCAITLRGGVKVHHNVLYGLFASFDQSRIRVLHQGDAAVNNKANKAGASRAELGGSVELNRDEVDQDGAPQYKCMDNEE